VLPRVGARRRAPGDYPQRGISPGRGRARRLRSEPRRRSSLPAIGLAFPNLQKNRRLPPWWATPVHLCTAGLPEIYLDLIKTAAEGAMLDGISIAQKHGRMGARAFHG